MKLPELTIETWPQLTLPRQEIQSALQYLAYKTRKPVTFRWYTEEEGYSDQSVSVRVFVNDGVTATYNPQRVVLSGQIFTDEEVKLILAEVKEHYSDAYPVIAAIAMTGARRAEMEHLRRENVDFERNLIHIEPDPETGWSPKNEASIRAVPMCPELRRIMEELLQRPDLPRHNYAFSDPDGNPLWQWEDFPLRRLQSAIRRLRNKKKVQVRFGTLRMLRHWFISYGLNRKDDPINPAEMIRLVGHTDMSMICRVYYHADLKKVSDKMESFKIVSEEPASYEVIPLGA